MNDDKSLSRRTFIQQLGVLGTVGLGAGTLLSACGGGEQAGTDTGTDTADADGGMAEAEEFSCTDTSGLTEQEMQMRQTLNYVDDSPHPDKQCDNCALWLPDAPIDGPCGGCSVVKGPIHPKGYCDSWAAKPA